MKYIKRIILSFILLYTYNLLAVNINMVIPLNLITILVITFLGIPGFISLVFFQLFL